MAAVCTVVLLIVGGTTAAIATAAAETGPGTITGTISDPSGYPLAGITVRLYDDGPDDGSLVGTATTTDAGRYRFSHVRTDGDDVYRFEAKDNPGGHVYSYSKSFPVAADKTTTSNLKMKIAGFIQGAVTTKDGSAPAQPGKHVYVDADGKSESGSALVSANGKFRLGGLSAGTYTLSFQDSTETFAPQCYSNVRMVDDNGCAGTTKVTVTAGKATTIKAQVLNHRTSLLSGTVTDKDGHPLSSASIEVYTATGNHLIGDSYTKDDGSWSLKAISYVGKVKIVARDSDGVLRDTWYDKAVDYAHATALPLKDGSEIDDILIVLPPK
jgi:protocatechuate 3,4-dioxygenase beta subunit